VTAQLKSMPEENVNMLEVAKLNPAYPPLVDAVNMSHFSVPIFMAETVQLSQ
jgi:hypothetical protein